MRDTEKEPYKEGVAVLGPILRHDGSQPFAELRVASFDGCRFCRPSRRVEDICTCNSGILITLVVSLARRVDLIYRCARPSARATILGERILPERNWDTKSRRLQRLRIPRLWGRNSRTRSGLRRLCRNRHCHAHADGRNNQDRVEVDFLKATTRICDRCRLLTAAGGPATRRKSRTYKHYAEWIPS